MYRHILLLLLLTSCSPSGPSYTPDLVHTNKAYATLVIYRPYSFFLSARTPDISINGIKSCELTNGGFFTKNVEIGKQTISSSLWDSPGTSRTNVEAKLGELRYVRVKISKDRALTGIGFGFIGQAISEGVSEQSGPFEINEVNESIAKSELQKLKMINDCN